MNIPLVDGARTKLRFSQLFLARPRTLLYLTTGTTLTFKTDYCDQLLSLTHIIIVQLMQDEASMGI